MINLLKEFKANKYVIFIITARDFHGTNQTMDQLRQYNIPYDFLYMRTPKSSMHFKSDLKKMLTDKGYQFVASVGDQPIDVEGDYSGLKLKLKSNL